MAFSLKALPPEADFETIPILKKTASAHRFLAELKGVSGSIPNQNLVRPRKRPPVITPDFFR